MASGGQLVAVDRSDGAVIGTSRDVVRGADQVEIGWTFLATISVSAVWDRGLRQ